MAKNSSPNKSAKLRQSSSLHNQALRYLSFRARSEKEMCDFLSRKGHSESEIDAELESLKELGLVNDTQFAQIYVESRSRSRPRSHKLLQLELRRKGIDLKSLSQITLPSEVELAQLALAKKKSLRSKDQAIRFLRSRGFSWEVIEKVIKNKYNDRDVN